MRSVVVVLPASMWAMMPMFLQRSNGTVLGTTINSFWGSASFSDLASVKFSNWVFENQNLNRPANCTITKFPNYSISLPPVVRKSLIGFGHAVHIFFLFDGRAFTIGGVQQFVAQLVDHATLGAAAGISQQPADRERGAAVGIYLHRDLIIRSAYAARLHFEQRLGVLDRLLEQLESFVAALFLHLGQGFVKDALSGRALALPHHRVNELRHQIRAIDGIGRHGPFGGMSFTRHRTPSFKVSEFLRLQSSRDRSHIETLKP